MYKNGAVVGLDQLRTLLVERGNSVRDVPMPVWQTYQNAVLRVRCTPKTRSNLELLIAGYSDLTESLFDLPLVAGQPGKALVQGLLDGDPLHLEFVHR